jgi:S-DNA-T family DNA segregation ATPase FtsK/SpoIIIE
VKQVSSKRQPASTAITQRLREGLLILCCTLSVYFLLSLITYHSSDPGWSNSGLSSHVLNMGGRAGAWLADFFLYLFGYVAYLFPILLTYAALLSVREGAAQPEQSHIFSLKLFGFILIIAAACALMNLHLTTLTRHLPYTSGGIFGDLLGELLVKDFNTTGATLFLLALLACGITLLSGLSWVKGSRFTWKLTCKALLSLQQNLRATQQRAWQQLKARQQERRKQKAQRPVVHIEPTIKAKPEKKSELFQNSVRQEPLIQETPRREVKPRIEPKLTSIKTSDRDQKERQMTLFKSDQGYHLPTLSLLDKNTQSKEHQLSKAALEAHSKEVEQRLMDFGIEARVVAVHPGPVITRYELELAPGIKVSRITSLAKDLARSLSTVSVRVVEVIPGKAVVGLELPNEHREVVRLREVLESQRYEQARSPLSLALGKDIAGHPVVVDIAKMPHLLVAGTTGSGKSVSLNAMLLSLLYKARPEEVRLILVDPKMLELAIYDGIPHLLTPVVTDMKDAANALRWCVAEMDRRYRLMAHLGVRNLSGYNQKVEDATKSKQPIPDPLFKPAPGLEPTYLETLPYIVVLIDEFADMMMVVGKKVEELIARIAQKARAAGIHLILATQRPSVDVITGLIKANIPTRIAFQVSSKIDSRTIIDQQGAETLLGHGDMLYLPPGTGVPIRIHGAFVADEEVHCVVAELKKQGQPQYLEEITSGSVDNDSQDPLLMGEGSGEQDPLYDEAVAFVTQNRKVSISSVQRRFKIGYNRAARIVEEMENAGVVSSMESNGSREVLAPAPIEIE